MKSRIGRVCVSIDEYDYMLNGLKYMKRPDIFEKIFRYSSIEDDEYHRRAFYYEPFNSVEKDVVAKSVVVGARLKLNCDFDFVYYSMIKKYDKFFYHCGRRVYWRYVYALWQEYIKNNKSVVAQFVRDNYRLLIVNRDFEPWDGYTAWNEAVDRDLFGMSTRFQGIYYRVLEIIRFNGDPDYVRKQYEQSRRYLDTEDLFIEED